MIHRLEAITKGFLDNAPVTGVEITRIEQVERQLAESEGRSRLLSMAVEQVSESIVITDPDGTINYVNPAFERVTGYTSDEVIGKNPRILQSGKHSPEFYRTLWDTLTSGRPWSGRFINKAKDGSPWEEETVISPVRDKNGNLIHYIAVKRDVTKERQAEDSLRYYKAIIESSTDAIIAMSLDKTITSWNAGAERTFGWTQGEVLGQPVSLLLQPERAGEEQEVLQRIQEGEYIAHYETIGKRKDGTLIDLAADVSPIKDSAGAIIGVSSVVRDITQQNHAEAEKAKLHAQIEDERRALQNIVASVPGIVWEAWGSPDANSQRIEFVSDYVEIMLGYRVEEWVSTPNFWLSIVHPEDKTRVAREAAALFNRCQAGKLEFRWIAKDGHSVWTESQMMVVTDQNGQPVGMRGVNIDVSERKELEQQLRQAKKIEAIGQLAGGVAHDFNNLLTIINGYSDLALSQLKPDDPVRHHMKEIKKAGIRAAGLTRQLLAFSRKQVLQPRVVDLNEIVLDTEKMLCRLIGENIELRTVLDPALGNVKVDPGQIEQVIMNLVVNARDAMPRGGTLVITTSNVEAGAEFENTYINGKPGPYVMLAVSDDGIGMDSTTQEHIFEPFFTTKELGKGTGLGLPTVYGIVCQSGGGIRFDSHLGRGTTFKIYFPRVVQSSGSAKETLLQAGNSLQGRETILLTEDDDAVRTLTRSVLETYGYHVLEAADAKAAFSVCESLSDRVDLLITDIVMPGRSGLELAHELERSQPELRILYMSGYTDSPLLQEEIFEHGTFLQKPFEPVRLAEKVREILDQPRRRRIA